MQYLEAITDKKSLFARKIFLAGGITECRDWQAEMVGMLKDLPVTVFNPRRKNFPIHDPNAAKEQITWEYHKLNEATHILFWFCRETICPIVLYELGRHLARRQFQDVSLKVYVGMDADYKRRQEVEIQSRLVIPSLKIHYSLEDLAAQIKSEIK